MPKEDTQFKKGNTFGNGRPKKPEWLKGKGEEALKFAYSVMTDENTKLDMRMQAARMLVEYDLGKPKQQLDVQADVGETTASLIAGMSLSERLDAVRAAAEAYNASSGK